MFEDLYPVGESSSLASLIVEEYTGLGRARQMTAENERLSVDQTLSISAAARRIAQGEPLQYVLGYTVFCGHRINVNRSVLIPRPETEELTSIIIEENKGFIGNAIDYCTGSGCIAISLALAFPYAKIHATDISEEAISVAEKNASLNKATVMFRHSDLLGKENEEYSDVDIIVSNPPYVRDSEKSSMRVNVLGHEPETALFVTDADPLKFYRRLSEKAMINLKPGGNIYLEINEALGEETATLLDEKNFREIHILKDLYGRDRFLKAKKR